MLFFLELRPIYLKIHATIWSMASQMRFRTGRKATSALKAKLVFWTKNTSVELPADSLRTILESVCEDFESQLVEIEVAAEGECRLVISYPPKHSVSSLIDSLKGVSSRMLRERPDIRRQCVNGKLWSPSYRAISVAGE